MKTQKPGEVKGTCLNWVIHLRVIQRIMVRGGGPVRLQAEFCFCTLPSCLLAFSLPENLEERPGTNHRQADKDKKHGVCGRRGQVACSLGPAGLNFSSPGSSGSLLTCLRPSPLTALHYICSPLKEKAADIFSTDTTTRKRQVNPRS